MGLYSRLIGIEDPKIPIHVFRALVNEWKRGKLARAQVIDNLSIAASEEVELDAIKAAMDQLVDPTTTDELFDALVCGERGIKPYNSETAIKQRIEDGTVL